MGDKTWLQTADWKSEKHVPVIDAPDKVKSGELVKVEVSVGKEIPHPNKTEHHIKWIDLFFWPDGAKFPMEVGYISFDTHGESAEGPNTGPLYSEPLTTFAFKTTVSGTLMATSYCNIHGLWKSEKRLEVE